jgi:CheY-like chemotaxis protein
MDIKGRQMKTFLVADDEPRILSFVDAVAQGMKYRVLKAHSAEEALTISDTQPAIDALITDVRMPGISGIELAQIFRVKYPTLPILLISGHDGEKDRIPPDLQKHPRAHYLGKPFTPQQLGSALLLLLAF